MLKQELFTYIVIACILFLCIKIYYESDAFQLKCIISSVDGNRYCVRERAKMQLAADLLAKVTQKCKILVEYMKQKYPDDDRVKRLVKGFNPTKISETLPTSEFTAYSEDKGKKVAFCLDKTKPASQLIALNTLTFIALHELSHITTKTWQHKREFWENFKFVLINAVDIGIYEPVDYKKKPEPYCGMDITDNPYFDL